MSCHKVRMEGRCLYEGHNLQLDHQDSDNLHGSEVEANAFAHLLQRGGGVGSQ
jgi:hypothetical protein